MSTNDLLIALGIVLSLVIGYAIGRREGAKAEHRRFHAEVPVIYPNQNPNETKL